MPTGLEEGDDLVCAALEFAEAAALLLDRDGRVLASNQAARKILTATGRGDARQGVFEATGERRVERFELPWILAANGELTEGGRYVIRTADRPQGYAAMAGAKLERDGNGEIVRAWVTLKEIAPESGDAMERLVLFDESPAGIVLAGEDGVIRQCNLSFAHMLGYGEASGLQGISMDEVLASRRFKDLRHALSAGGVLRDQPLTARKRDGLLCELRFNARLLRRGVADSGPAIAISALNMSDHNRAERATRNAEQRFAEFARHTPGMVFIRDRHGRFLFLSGAALHAMNIDPAIAIGKTGHDILPADLADEFRNSDQEVLRSGMPVRALAEVEIFNKLHRMEVCKFPIPDETGALTLVGGIAADQPAGLPVEPRLLESEKMDAIGQTAAAMAHDFNNKLQVISGFGQMLADALQRNQPKEKLSSFLGEIMAASNRAAELNAKILTFGRKHPARVVQFDLCELIGAMAPALRDVLGANIELSVENAPAPCLIQADTDQMRQTILNLALNARDAMAGGGTLRIKTAARVEHAPPGSKPGLFVLVQVTDNGIGISENVRPRIFEPFFTTKPKGHGSGLGLSVVYGFVRQMGGDIDAIGALGKGTRFNIYLPVSEASSGPGVPAPGSSPRYQFAPEPVAASLCGTETILVAEDEDTVRNLVKAILERYGYKIMVASHPHEALRLYDKHAGTIDLLLTDVIMPDMTGTVLAQTIRRANPKLKVVYMSGYAPEEIANRAMLETVRLIHKPFSAESLAKHIRERLDQTDRDHTH